jgi:ABC-type microcin C transport system duplicated ATPase subunit YejF
MDLLPSPRRPDPGGAIRVSGTDLVALTPKPAAPYRGRTIAHDLPGADVEPNPAFTVGEQIAENVRLHLKLSRARRWKRAVAALNGSRSPTPPAAPATTRTTSAAGCCSA